METENAVKVLGGRSDHQMADYKPNIPYSKNPNEYENNSWVNHRQAEEESILNLKLLSEPLCENAVINSPSSSHQNSFAQSVTKKLSLLFEPTPMGYDNRLVKSNGSALNQELSEIVHEFVPCVDQLKPIAQALHDIENSKSFRDLAKVLDVCYRPYFWAVAQGNDRMMALVQIIQSELDLFEQNKSEYENASRQSTELAARLSAERQTLEDEIRTVSSALEQSKAVAGEFESQLSQLDIDNDQLRLVAFAVDELQSLNKDAQSIKKSLQLLGERVTKISNAATKVKFEASNFTISLYEYEQNEFDFDDLLVRLKHFPVALGLVSTNSECPLLPKFEFEDLFSILDSYKFSERVARQYLTGLLDRACEYLEIAKSLEAKLMEELSGVEIKMGNHPLKHYRIFQSKLLSSAFNLLRSADDAENASASFETRLESLNQKLDIISASLSKTNNQADSIEALLTLKEHEDYILAKIDDLNRNGAGLVIGNLRKKQLGHWIVAWIMIIRKFKIEKLSYCYNCNLSLYVSFFFVLVVELIIFEIFL